MNRFFNILAVAVMGLGAISVQADQKRIFFKFVNKTDNDYILQATSDYQTSKNPSLLEIHDLNLVITAHSEKTYWPNLIWNNYYPGDYAGAARSSEVYILYNPVTRQREYLGSLVKSPNLLNSKTEFGFQEITAEGEIAEDHQLMGIKNNELEKSTLGVFFTITNGGIEVDFNALIVGPEQA